MGAMARRINIFLCVCTLILVFAFQSNAAVNTNEAAPVFALKDSNGNEQQLASYQEKYVVLEWLNHECPFVRKHYDSGSMQDLQKEYTEKGVVWFSIISSAPGKQGYCTADEAVKLTEQEKAHPTAVLLDPDGAVGKLYEAKTTPHMFIIDPQRVLIYQGAIDDIASTDTADIGKANNYVRMVLDEAMAGKEVSVASTKSYGCSVKY